MPTPAELAAELRRRAAEQTERVRRSMRPPSEPPSWLVAVAKWASVPALAILTAFALWLNASAKETEERAKAYAAEREAQAAERQSVKLRLDELEKRATACEELKPKVTKLGTRLRPLEAWHATYTRANPHRSPLPLVVESDEED
jgi:hypothetical protein